MFFRKKINEENEQRREAMIEADSGFGQVEQHHQSTNNQRLSVINEGSMSDSNQGSRSRLAVNNTSPGRRDQGQINQDSPGQLNKSQGNNGQQVIPSGSFDDAGNESSSSINQLSVHASIHRSHSSSNVEPEQDHNYLVRQHSTPGHPFGASSDQLRPSANDYNNCGISPRHQQQQRHHSGPQVRSGGGGHGRRTQQPQFIRVQEERPGNFREDRDFGAMPPIGSAEAEFQNDFIAVFPMRHLEPQPDLR